MRPGSCGRQKRTSNISAQLKVVGQAYAGYLFISLSVNVSFGMGIYR